MKCVLCIKESYFKGKKGQIFHICLQSGWERWPPHPYGQPDLKIPVFFDSFPKQTDGGFQFLWILRIWYAFFCREILSARFSHFSAMFWPEKLTLFLEGLLNWQWLEMLCWIQLWQENHSTSRRHIIFGSSENNLKALISYLPHLLTRIIFHHELKLWNFCCSL